jgi:hypothetical protein
VADGAVIVRGDKECIMALHQFRDTVSDGRVPFRLFFTAWSTLRMKAWESIRVTGGNFFGQVWEAMKPQYTRKDGTVVPAWGGVPRVSKGWKKGRVGTKSGQRSVGSLIKNRGGNVSGKMRPSGRRVAQTSVMMQDTGTMKRDVLASPISVEARRMVIGPKGNVVYAEKQDEMRPFCFWQIPQDEELAVKAFQSHVDKQVDKFNQPGR